MYSESISYSLARCTKYLKFCRIHKLVWSPLHPWCTIFSYSSYKNLHYRAHLIKLPASTFLYSIIFFLLLLLWDELRGLLRIFYTHEMGMGNAGNFESRKMIGGLWHEMSVCLHFRPFFLLTKLANYLASARVVCWGHSWKAPFGRRAHVSWRWCW